MIVCIVIIVILSLIIVGLALPLMGAIKKQNLLLETYRRKDLSGVEIETIRRLAVAKGSDAVTLHDILNLIYTIRSIQLGGYEDKDVFVFSQEDPYDGLSLEMKYFPE